MRRAEKMITERKEIDAIIAGATVMRLAMIDGNSPYIVPLSFGYDGEKLYFHCAKEGRKLDILAANNQVAFEFEENVELLTHPEKACNWSFAYKSVVGFGVAVALETHEEKSYGLECIMKQYSAKSWNFADISLAAICVFAIAIDEITGKRSPAE